MPIPCLLFFVYFNFAICFVLLFAGSDENVAQTKGPGNVLIVTPTPGCHACDFNNKPNNDWASCRAKGSAGGDKQKDRYSLSYC